MKRILFTTLLMLFAVSAFAADICVRDGGDNSASATCGVWGSTACNTLATVEAIVTRDQKIYVASGDYEGTTWNVANDGTKQIIVRKATIAEHGDCTGWNDAYATGPAYLTHNIVTTNYWWFDGVYGGGPGDWDGEYGFTFESVDTDTGDWWNITDRDFLRFSHMSFYQTGNVRDQNNGMSVFVADTDGNRIDNSIFEYTKVFNIGGPEFFFRYGDHTLIQYAYALEYCQISFNSIDNHCEWLVEWKMNDMTIRYSWLGPCYAIGCTGVIVKNDDINADSNGKKIYGNVIYGVAPIVCGGTHGGQNYKIINNTFVLMYNAMYLAGSCIVTGTVVVNNINAYAGVSKPSIAEFGPIYHDYNYTTNSDSSLCDMDLQAHENGSPHGGPGGCSDMSNTATGGYTGLFVNYPSVYPDDFRLSGHLTAAIRDGSPLDPAGVDVCIAIVVCTADDTYDIDAYGVTRGSTGGIWDVGFAQFTDGSPTFVSISPSSGVQGTSFSVTVTGSSTEWESMTSVLTFSGTGVSAGDTTCASVTSCTATVTVTGGATLSVRDVIMTTGMDVDTLDDGFTVNAAPAAGTGGIRLRIRIR